MDTAIIRKEFILEGLCCGNCAAKIEQEVGNLEGVSSATVDFVSKTFTMEIADGEKVNSLVAQADSIVKLHDPDIMMNEKETLQPGKKVIYLFGLCCADCAQKIEKQVNLIDGVKTAVLDFVSQKLTIEALNQKDLPGIIRQASQIALEIEPDIQISYTNKKNDQEASRFWKKWAYRIGLGTGAAIFAAGMLFDFGTPAEFILFFLSYLLIGGEVIYRALKNISKGQVFDENFLMSVATIGAFAIGEYPEGVAVMLFYQIGEAFQQLAVNRSRKSISSLMDIRPDFANLQIGNELRKVTPEEVGIGDVIIVKPGEKVPLDGRVLDGRSALDLSALTGESLPRDVEPGSEVLSGSINKNGLLTIEVSKEFGESTISKILDLVQNASSKKAPTENFITKFARYYTPFVVFAALALAVIPPLLIAEATFADWINRALVFLVVSCPCALVISIPLSFFGGIGGASKNGILIKGSNYLEALNNVDTVVFDKTGTLTKGVFNVAQITAAGGWSQDDLLFYAAHAEGYSNHPIALSIQKAYGQEIDTRKLSEHEELSGLGIRVKVDGKTVLAGNSKLLDAENIPCQKEDTSGTVVYLAVDGVFAGTIVISDEIKPDSKQAIKDLRSIGVRSLVMLTGDSKTVGEKIAGEIGLDAVYADLLPHQKVEQLENLEKEKPAKGKLVFVGDGVNDAPVLARSDIGIAMGGLGSDAAIEAADVVLMTDEPSKLVSAIRIAHKTRGIVWQNILFALGVKAVILVLGALGIATMWEAVFGDVGVAIIAILNAMRAMRVVE
ncbi:cadmium-translocating P-type ATPase [Syntrophobotulus glycolicus DSM 8271]|uniref:Cadmium-translocating P-type ATPase n=1 Tax=Syntrophobotulus glycolicus (strain DSM 8271 / FlGlyR) TaxID=645991 RepID=F0SX39_SYNGF|nr:heavy metal translocating P-type ATPase [Syntrophobotulus glycolicus]ADY55822.1 cadmium-translocating P-type ATPase [Syntrophobotulus glycolicus DSM 8271]